YSDSVPASARMDRSSATAWCHLWPASSPTAARIFPSSCSSRARITRIQCTQRPTSVGETASGVLCATAILFASGWIARRRREGLLATLRAEGSNDARSGRRFRVPFGSTWLILPACALSWFVGGAVAGLPGAIAGAAATALTPRILLRRRTARRMEALESDLGVSVYTVDYSM